MADPHPIADVAEAGNRGNTLRTLRDRIAYQLDETSSARDVASLSKRLMEVLAQIDGLPAGEKLSPADEIAKRRATRRAG